MRDTEVLYSFFSFEVFFIDEKKLECQSHKKYCLACELASKKIQLTFSI